MTRAEQVTPAPESSPAPAGRASRVIRTLAGRRSDWRLVRPRIGRPRWSVGSIGPLLVLASVGGSWFAFDSANGRGSVAFGLYIGAVSILLMAWSFVLSVRLRSLETIFGGLDRAYRAHRWTGTLAVIAMFLHIRVEPEIKGGILGASESLADSARDLAGVAEYLLYGLIAISLIRWFPYRYWRLTHKLLGVPFVFASFHFFTAEKPYANGSAWGWWFGAWMVAGTAAYLWRVVARDVARPGHRYRITSADTHANTIDLRLAPESGRPLPHRDGQFAFVKVQLPGLREPHPFTIASPPGATELRFLVRGLGDWSSRLQCTELVGATVIVEGPYGAFAPLEGDRQHLWVAGGVGVTPFLAAIGGLAPGRSPELRPMLVYCVRARAEAMALDELEQAAADGRIRLSLHVSDEGSRLDTSELAHVFGRADLAGVDVAVCGPAALVSAVGRDAHRLGARHVHSEDFDIRQGFGPDLSTALLRR